MLSITLRLLISLSLVLTSFLGITAFVLDKAFQKSVKDATQDRLQGYAMALIASAEVRIDGSVYIPDILPIVRFNQSQSGLYAQVTNFKGKILWQSESSNEKVLPKPPNLKNTETLFTIDSIADGELLFNYNYGVSWDVSNRNLGYTINILESLDSYNKETKNFRQTLWLLLGGVALLLLIVQGSLMRWSLKPLRHAALEIESIESGEQSQLQSVYPKELGPLTKNINALIKSNKQHLTRYRNSSSDLAHSLKTPLALLRSASESNDPRYPLEKVVAEQVDQMKKIVDYQLQRASTSGKNPLSKPVNLFSVIHKICNSLDKVYADKKIAANLPMDEELLFFGDESDLFEMLGNVLDNAYKWADSNVQVRIESKPKQLLIHVDDDGPGIDPKLIKKVLERGIRSDERDGTGIGLAVVSEIVQAYDGDINIDKSDMGGCHIGIKLSQNH